MNKQQESSDANKIKIGDRLYVSSNNGLNNKYLTVSWVGKKYFKFDEIKHREFIIDTLAQRNEGKYSLTYHVFKTEQDFLDQIASHKKEVEKQAILNYLRSHFNNYTWHQNRLPLEKLQQIKLIIESEN